MKLIGFLGSECYDIIKLTAIVAKHFDAKILLIDVSANESLKNTFSDSNVNEFNLVEQNGVFFYNHNLGSSGVHPKEYDYVFIYFAYNYKHSMLAKCKEVYVVSDMQRHTINRLNKMHLPDKMPRFLVLTNSVEYRCVSKNFEALVPNLKIAHDSVFRIPVNENDLKNRVDCSFNSKSWFSKASQPMQDVVLQILGAYYPPKKIQMILKRLTGKGR